jgi:hypothetical protein
MRLGRQEVINLYNFLMSSTRARPPDLGIPLTAFIPKRMIPEKFATKRQSIVPEANNRDWSTPITAALVEFRWCGVIFWVVSAKRHTQCRQPKILKWQVELNNVRRSTLAIILTNLPSFGPSSGPCRAPIQSHLLACDQTGGRIW